MALAKDTLEKILEDFGHLLDEEQYQKFFDEVYKIYRSTAVLELFNILCPDGDDDLRMLKTFDAIDQTPTSNYFGLLIMKSHLKDIELNPSQGIVSSNWFSSSYQHPELQKLTFGPNINSVPKVKNQLSLETLVLEGKDLEFKTAGITNNPKLKTIDVSAADSIHWVNEKSFADNPMLESMDLSLVNAAKYGLGDGLFLNDASLKTVILPDGLKRIPESCFKGCRNLETIFLPDSVEKIEAGAFEGCNKVQIRMHRRPDGQGIKIPQGDLDFYKQHLKIKK